VVRVHLGPPTTHIYGAIAQLGERLPCKQEVSGSIPLSSTTLNLSIRRGFLFDFERLVLLKTNEKDQIFLFK
jgi:hypothetical protein